MGQKPSQHHHHHHHHPPAVTPATPAPPPPPPTFDEPWRKISWDGRDEMLEQLKEFVPHNPHIQQVRILLHGPVGVGKSSFVNSINNVFQNRITSVALVASGMEGKSFTTKYKTHKIENQQSGSSYSFVFNDIMGLEDASGEGMHTYDIVSALKGQVKDGYKFRVDNKPLSAEDAGYRKSPGLGDKAHCLVSLIAADKVSVMSDDVIKKMKTVRLEASDLGIPQIVILTRVDLACPLVKKNLRNVYKSKYMKEVMEKCSVSLGVPVNCILPVKNYHEETDLNTDVDALLLRALRQMVDFADNFSNDVPLSGAMVVLVPLRQYATLFLGFCVQVVREAYKLLRDWNTQPTQPTQPTHPNPQAARRRQQTHLQTQARQWLRREAVQ